ncbi:50S ribosomal protein L15e [Candidatus Woesearchaeota archaeon]|nr:50S ribosomal protein L15e [Candidatus Woesearchaeota archaeon]
MGVIANLRKIWKKPTAQAETAKRERLLQWRKEPVCVRIKNPTRLDRARALGYTAKQGIILVRVRVLRGGHSRPKRVKGRRSKGMTRKLVLRKNYKQIAEERADKKYSNCEVLNSYYVAKDGKNIWHEVILVDRDAAKNSKMSWISNKRGRAQRGLTSAGKKSRGLRHKGKGAEKARPSRRAHNRRQ